MARNSRRAGTSGEGGNRDLPKPARPLFDHGWAKLPHPFTDARTFAELPKVTHLALIALVRLAHAQGTPGHARSSIRDLARYMNVSRNSVRRALEAGAALGYWKCARKRTHFVVELEVPRGLIANQPRTQAERGLGIDFAPTSSDPTRILDAPQGVPEDAEGGWVTGGPAGSARDPGWVTGGPGGGSRNDPQAGQPVTHYKRQETTEETVCESARGRAQDTHTDGFAAMVLRTVSEALGEPFASWPRSRIVRDLAPLREAHEDAEILRRLGAWVIGDAWARENGLPLANFVQRFAAYGAARRPALDWNYITQGRRA